MVTAVGTLGKTYIVRDTDKFYYKDASVICFENYGKLCSEYLRYLMMSPYMETVIKDNSSGTTVGTITLVRANEYLIPLPPLAEQKRIENKELAVAFARKFSDFNDRQIKQLKDILKGGKS